MNERPLTPLLDRMECVLSVELEAGGLFCFRETALGDYSWTITRDEVVELAGELLALAVYADDQSE